MPKLILFMLVIGPFYLSAQIPDNLTHKQLSSILDSIYNVDQQGRNQLDSITENFGQGSDEYQNHWEEILANDQSNLEIVSSIINQYGWLGSDEVSKNAQLAQFLVIQHADIETQLKYIPSMRDAVLAKKAQATNLALLEDRIAIRQGKKQIYGSQIGINENGEHYILPLADPTQVDQRRANVGLPPLQEYVSYWGIIWDMEAYLKEQQD